VYRLAPEGRHRVAKAARELDITDLPELRRLAEEVAVSDAPCRLVSGDRVLAVISPAGGRNGASESKPRRRRSEPYLTKDDPLFGLIGIGASGIPGGVSSNKHEALASAYRPKP
jgi:hypothetical protein